MLGRNKKTAIEEYMVSSGAKEPAAFEAEKKEICICDCLSDTQESVRIRLTAPGYLEIEVFSAGSAICPERKVITTDEFTDGVYDLGFRIRSGFLHNGKNFAKIVLRTPTQSQTIKIILDNKIRTGSGGTAYKKIVAGMCRDYLDLQIGRLFQGDWQEKYTELLKNINGSDITDLFLLLFKVNVLSGQGRGEEAGNLLSFVAAQMRKLPEVPPELSAYFLYVRSLFDMDDDRTAGAMKKVRRIYEETPSWRILWMLIYMDPFLYSNPEQKLELIRTEYSERGCRSPVMYYEAVQCYRQDPSLVSNVDSFVIQALNFGTKEGILSFGIAMEFADAIWRYTETEISLLQTKVLVHILKVAYDKLKSPLVLKSLCRVLILNNCRGPEDHKYYKSAIDEFIEMPGIYSYYMMTADRKMRTPLHIDVIRYFDRHPDALGREEAYFYACIVTEKKHLKDTYNKFADRMLEFAKKNIAAGKSDCNLGIIYQDLFETNRVSPDMCQRMYEILCVRKISVKNNLLSSVIVFHKELPGYQEAEIEDDAAYVKIYSPDAIILFKDASGNLYKNIEYTCEELLEGRRYVDVCLRDGLISRFMFVGDALPLLRAYKDHAEILDALLSQIGSGGLRPDYEQSLLKDMILYFKKNSRDSEVRKKLLSFMKFDLDDETRGRLIDIMIEQKLFKEAFDEIERHSFIGISPEAITSLAHFFVQLSDLEENDTLLDMCMISFVRCGYEPEIFRYLCKYYDGECDVLYKMYIAARAHDIKDTEIAERTLRAAIRERNFSSDIFNVFKNYYENGEDAELKQRYITELAHKYIYDDDTSVRGIFPYMLNELGRGAAFDNAASVAFVLYMANAGSLSARSSKIVQDTLEDLVRHGIMLEQMKACEKFFALPSQLSNAYIAAVLKTECGDAGSGPVTVRSIGEGVPRITYEIRGSGNVKRAVEPMNEIFPGCYVKYFTLFHGESVICSIDGREELTAQYRQRPATEDGSRFSEIDDMLCLAHSGRFYELEDAALDYYIKDSLINRIF